jgi:hypothetical protein
MSSPIVDNDLTLLKDWNALLPLMPMALIANQNKFFPLFQVSPIHDDLRLFSLHSSCCSNVANIQGLYSLLYLGYGLAYTWKSALVAKQLFCVLYFSEQ